jgi:aromatic-L-amino-acid decarboxylase
MHFADIRIKGHEPMSSSIPPLGDMNPKTFQQYGYQVVDWITEYLTQPEQYPVLSRSQPGEIKQQLPGAPPTTGESMAAVLTDFQQVILPGVTHWNHPGFMAYFNSTASGPGILGEMLIAALNVNAMLWKTSPAATELEEVTLDWLRQMLGLPPGLEGVIMDGASVASMIAIAAAREAVDGLNARVKGLAGRPEVPRLRVYISEQSHSSLEKGAIILGIGQENVIAIPTDDAFRMRPEALADAIAADLAAGYRPFFVCATVGTTSTTSIDPVAAIADIAQQNQLWLHVDGAYGGTAAIMPEMRHVLAGAERADSIVVNPHKWLFTPLDLSAFYIRHPDTLRRAFSLVPEYLRSAEGDAALVKNYMDYGVQMGRRFRALKLWMIIRAFGQEGLAHRLREHVRLAQQFARWVDDSPDFERMAPTPFSTVCFRANPQGLDEPEALNDLNEALLEAVNATGEMFISHTSLHGQYTLRLAISSIRTMESHVRRAWELLQTQLANLQDDKRH